ncbi:IS3 family transposase [Erwinia aphidicola]|uniref:IS3 family transposase n=1 Tax=Erwinia aphidicola TaxID=68334 RepID=UPI003D19EFE0
MHSYEDRVRAVELYYRYGKKASVVIRELGYPSIKQLGRWVRIYEETGELPRELKSRQRYSLLDRYIRWYNEKRIKVSLGAMSPVKYRQHLGITT